MERKVFSTSGAEKNEYPHIKKKQNSTSTLYHTQKLIQAGLEM